MPALPEILSKLLIFSMCSHLLYFITAWNLQSRFPVSTLGVLLLCEHQRAIDTQLAPKLHLLPFPQEGKDYVKREVCTCKPLYGFALGPHTSLRAQPVVKHCGIPLGTVTVKGPLPGQYSLPKDTNQQMLFHILSLQPDNTSAALRQGQGCFELPTSKTDTWLKSAAAIQSQMMLTGREI